MSRTFLSHRYLSLSAALILAFSIGHTVFSQHEGHDMAGMHKTKPTARKKKSPARKKTQVKKHQMGNMAGMNMPGMQKGKPVRRRNRTRMTSQPAKKHQLENMPGMNMPQSPSSTSPGHQASPGHKDMNMPGMHTQGSSSPPSAKPTASPQMDMNMPMPGMSHGASPGAAPQKMDMNMPMPSESPGAKSGTMDNMKGMDMSGTGAMSMGPLMVMSGNDMSIRVGSSDTNLMPMGQMGSGTSWAPANTPMYMIHKQSGDWLLMFHYNVFVGMNSQGGPRGVTKFESANWFMPMAFHKLGKGTLQLRGMFSFEPFTFPPGGSPLLFQTGETYKSQPLIDKQHPHDLFMELSAQYTHPLGERGTWFTYFGYPGEPALGPPAFMHRQSASENPSATLSHHLQDSTHISFGVLTTGFTYRWFKLEGSVFNGREPDENRYNFDAHRWNSRSARLSFAPNNNWSMQLSYGFLRSPEAVEPDTDIRRVTASVHYNKAINRGNWASAFVWGRNHTSSPGETHNLNGYTLESTVNFLDQNYLYTRLELVDKNELLRAVDRAQLGITDDHPSFRIGAYTFGGARDIWKNERISMAIGSDLTFYSKPAVLDQLYGANPVSWKLFVRLRPGRMDMASMHGTHGHASEETKPMKH
jgi:hypothetical protein